MRVCVCVCLCLCVFVYCLGIVTVLIFNVQVGQFALMDGVQMGMMVGGIWNMCFEDNSFGSSQG